MMRVLVVAPVLWAATFSAALAQEVDCDAATTQSDMNRCAMQDYTDSDILLNEAYVRARGAMKRLDMALPKDMRGAEATLRSAQQDWIRFRDNACAAEGYLMKGGSAEPLLVYGCMTRLTDQRTQDLKSLTLGAEG